MSRAEESFHLITPASVEVDAKRLAMKMSRSSCVSRAWASGKASESFTMDPLLSSAELDLTAKGKRYQVKWTGNEGFGMYQGFEACMSQDDEEPREGQGGGLVRSAEATGHIFGQHLVTKRFGAVLMSGAMVTECTQSRELAGLQPGQSIRIIL
jgi:hypothetical protein